MKLALEDQQFLLAANEYSELWEVASTVFEVGTLIQYEPVRRIAFAYMDKGWVQVARMRWPRPEAVTLEPLAEKEARAFLALDANWDVPTGAPPDPVRIGRIVLSLTDKGHEMLKAGAAADAFARIGEPRDGRPADRDR